MNDCFSVRVLPCVLVHCSRCHGVTPVLFFYNDKMVNMTTVKRPIMPYVITGERRVHVLHSQVIEVLNLERSWAWNQFPAHNGSSPLNIIEIISFFYSWHQKIHQPRCSVLAVNWVKSCVVIFSCCSVPEGKGSEKHYDAGLLLRSLHFCGRASLTGLTRFRSSFPPVAVWYSGWSMRQKATLVRDSLHKFLLGRMSQDPDICFKGVKKKESHRRKPMGEKSAVKWTKPANKCLTATLKDDRAHTLFFTHTVHTWELPCSSSVICFCQELSSVFHHLTSFCKSVF